MEQEAGLTVSGLARARGLPEEYLRTLGVTNGVTGTGKGRTPCVDVLYTDHRGRVVGVQKVLSIQEGIRYEWRRGDHPMIYGLRHLSSLRGTIDYVVLVGGADMSSVWVLWRHGVPAVGIPEPEAWNETVSTFLQGITTYLWPSPDDDGVILVQAVAKDLPGVRLIEPFPASNGPVGLYLEDHGEFAKRVVGMLREAGPAPDRRTMELDRQKRRLLQEAEPLLKDPAILHKAIGIVQEHLGVAGEEKNIGIVRLAMRSRVLPRPVNLEVNSPTSTGKSHIVDRTLKLEDASACYELGAGSERTLIYTQEPLSYRILVIPEPDSLPRGVGYAIMKTLLWEGKLRYETVVKRGGELVTLRIEKDGPTGIILCTTKDVDKQISSRMLRLETNLSPEQTARILREIARSADGSREPSDLAPWRAYSQLLGEAIDVKIPYASWLSDRMPKAPLRIRRDFNHFLTLIKASAVEHRFQRRMDGHSLLATTADYAIVHTLAADLFGAIQDEDLNQTDRSILREVSDLSAVGPVSQGDLVQRLGFSKGTISTRVRHLLATGYLTNAEARVGVPAKLNLAEPYAVKAPPLPKSCELSSYLMAEGRHDLIQPWVNPITGEWHNCQDHL